MYFGLKNVRATYQRLVTKIFQPLLGETMEVYIDDMIVKSKKCFDHTKHLQESFELLRKYSMKLNPLKCAFVMSVQKHSLHTRYLACLHSILHLKNRYFVISLIFSFIYDLVGKLVQFEAYWRLEERDFTTLLQRHDIEVNNTRLVFTAQRRNVSTSLTLRCHDTYMLKL